MKKRLHATAVIFFCMCAAAFAQNEWTLQKCIEYALKENISLKQSRLNAESSAIDIKTAKAAMFPNLSFSTSQNVINRPYQENSTTVSGTEILLSNNSTSYSGSYGLNAQWVLFNGGKVRKTLEQDKLTYEQAELNIQTQSNSIVEAIASTYIQILYASEV